MTKARDLANAGTALTSVSATELGYLDGVTSAVQTQLDAKLASSTAATTYVANALADAKGDIFVASADNTVTRLPVGSTGDTIVADSSTSTGLRYQGSIAAGKNFLINGNFDIWQRGTSFASSGYLADRWTDGGVLASITASQQTATAPDGSRYYLRFTSTGTGSYKELYQFLETNTAAALWGRTVTFSIKLRRDSTFNANFAIVLDKSSTIDAGTGASWTTIGSTSVTGSSLSTTTWTTSSFTAAIPNDGTANSIRIRIYYTTNPPNGAYVEFAQAQLELGSVPTTFSRAGGTIQGETSACQRYYFRMTPGSAYGPIGIGLATSGAASEIDVTVPVSMRVPPTSVQYGNLTLHLPGVILKSFTALTLAYTGFTNQTVSTTGSTGLVTSQTYKLTNDNNVAGFIAFSAEL
jgi:hypothetical protein